jgi:type I restriction enzyme M protein
LLTRQPNELELMDHFMDHSAHNKLVSFIWSIADDCLRDVYVRGKYRDVILPMFVLRRLDCLLEATKPAVLEEVRFQRQEVGLTILDPEGLKEASGYLFYNISDFTLTKLTQTASNNRQILEANFQAYLDGFSDDVKEIVEKFKLRAQVRHMADKDVLLDVLEKFTSPYINLTPNEAVDPDGRKLPPLTNLGMGYVFEELIRKFNEENNEEAGEHFTPREVINLMTHILFLPVKEQLPPVILVYDGACGSGGMLTEAQNFISDPNGLIRSNAAIHLYGKEINDETYAICKSDMMIKGNNPENIKNGSTLASDEFAGLHFDFMLSNPPYGKSWKSDQRFIKDGSDVIDPRFQVKLQDFRGQAEIVDATPRSSDGQLLFLMDMVSKMKARHKSPLGSRIASVHNGSSLFTGDAGSGESNIRRYLIENDWLEAIIQLPNNLFYNTGITTYIWVLSNHKAPQRRGKVQLIDASELYRKLRKNLGAKNCEFAPEHIEQITQCYLEMWDETTAQPPPILPQPGGGTNAVRENLTCDAPNSTPPVTVPSPIWGGLGRGSSPTLRAKLFNNQDFGYYQVTIERPQRLAAQLTADRLADLRFAPALQAPMRWMYEQWGEAVYDNLTPHAKAVEAYLEQAAIELAPKQRKELLDPKLWQRQRHLLHNVEALLASVGEELWLDFNRFSVRVEQAIKGLGLKWSSGEKRQLLNAVSWRDERAAKVIAKSHQLSGKKLADLLTTLNCTVDELPDYGYWRPEPPEPVEGRRDEVWVEYEPDSDLRDTENVPLTEQIHPYFGREVRPHLADAWIALDKTKIGYEISFNKYFYRHTPLRTLSAVTADILRLEAETDGLLKRLVSFGEGQG